MSKVRCHRLPSLTSQSSSSLVHTTRKRTIRLPVSRDDIVRSTVCENHRRNKASHASLAEQAAMMRISPLTGEGRIQRNHQLVMLSSQPILMTVVPRAVSDHVPDHVPARQSVLRKGSSATAKAQEALLAWSSHLLRNSNRS